MRTTQQFSITLPNEMAQVFTSDIVDFCEGLDKLSLRGVPRDDLRSRL